MESLLGEPKIESNVATNRDMSNEIIDFFHSKILKLNITEQWDHWFL